MGERKHTPGPWRLSKPDMFGDYAIQPPNEELAIAAIVNGEMRRMGGQADEHAANARLIAAAPEMLAALYEAREFIDGQIDVVDGSYGEPAPNRAMTLAQEIDAAIAKATGSALASGNRADD